MNRRPTPRRARHPPAREGWVVPGEEDANMPRKARASASAPEPPPTPLQDIDAFLSFVAEHPGHVIGADSWRSIRGTSSAQVTSTKRTLTVPWRWTEPSEKSRGVSACRSQFAQIAT